MQVNTGQVDIGLQKEVDVCGMARAQEDDGVEVGEVKT